MMVVENHELRIVRCTRQLGGASIFLSRLAVAQASWSVINHTMPARESQHGKRAAFAAIATVAATFAYFLLFAQFGFLKALQLVAGGEQEVIKRVLALMGAAGILGSVVG